MHRTRKFDSILPRGDTYTAISKMTVKGKSVACFCLEPWAEQGCSSSYGRSHTKATKKYTLLCQRMHFSTCADAGLQHLLGQEKYAAGSMHLFSGIAPAVAATAGQSPLQAPAIFLGSSLRIVCQFT